jgi:hypothetical protein
MRSILYSSSLAPRKDGKSCADRFAGSNSTNKYIQLNIHLRIAFQTGKPVEAILEYIRSEGISLVVVNTHGRTGLGRMIFGSFQRSIRLPAGVDSEKVKADFRNGVVRIEMPKSEKSKTRQIAVQGA